jgi:phosphatidate cytidylyltransferase
LLVTRLITGAIGIPILAAVVWVGGPLLAAVVALAVFVAQIEFAIARDAQRNHISIAGALCGASLPALALAAEEYVLGGAVATIGIVSTAYVFTKSPKDDIENWLWGVTGALYLGGLAAFFVLLREVENGRDWLLFTLITVWVTDTGAYAVGRAIGRHKLAPAISPGKTIEGSLGSVLTGFACVFVLNEVLDLGLALEHRIALGLLLPAIIGIGDLAESAVKRALAVKDSSGLVPGHGGIADRLDSLLFAAPLVFYYLTWVVAG